MCRAFLNDTRRSNFHISQSTKHSMMPGNYFGRVCYTQKKWYRNSTPRSTIEPLQGVPNSLYPQGYFFGNGGYLPFKKRVPFGSISFLFFQGRKLRKRQKLFAVWTQSGNILIRTSPESSPRAVNTINEIKAVINEDTTGCDTNSEESETTNYEDLFEELLNQDLYM